MDFLHFKRIALVVFLLPGVGVFAQTSPPVGVVAAGGTALVSDLVNAATGALSRAEVFIAPFGPVAVNPDGRFVFVSGGVTGSTVYGGTIDALNGTLTPTPGTPYLLAGPNPITSMAVEASGHFLYAGSLSGLLGGSIDQATGELTPIAGSPLAVTNVPLALVSDTAGKYLYTLEVLGIKAWAIDAATGALTPVGSSGFASTAIGVGLAMDPLNRFLFASTSWGIYGFSIDSATGGLTPLAGSPFYGGNVGLGVTFDASGKFLYVAQPGRNALWGFAVDSVSGNLTAVPESPFLCAPKCSGVAADASGKYVYAGTFPSGVLAYQIDGVTGTLKYINGITPGGPIIAVVPAVGSPTATLQSLQILPANPTVHSGLKQQFTAEGAYSDGTQRFLTGSVTWSSSNSGVATITNALGQNGLATATGSGSATITAKLGALTATTTLTVH